MKVPVTGKDLNSSIDERSGYSWNFIIIINNHDRKSDWVNRDQKEKGVN